MPAVAIVSHNPHLQPAVQEMAARHNVQLLQVAATANWSEQNLQQHVDVFVIDAALLSEATLANLQQLAAGCTVVACRAAGEPGAILLDWGIFHSIVLDPQAALSDALALQLEGQLAAALALSATRRELAELRRKLSARDEILDLVGRATHDGMWEWDLRHDAITFSPRWKQMLGFDSAAVGHAPSEWFDRVHPDEREQLLQDIEDHRSGVTEYFQNQHRLRHQDGQYRWMISRGQALRDAAGAPTKLVGSHTDITTQKQSEQRLLHDAFHDTLTGLANNALLRDRLQRAAAYARRRRDYMYAVLFLDIDRFKNINDSLGHVEGDQLLMAVAERLRHCVRPVDLVARLGGDEFVILLDDIGDRQEAARSAERVQRALALPFRLGKQEIFASASIGIALSGSQLSDPYDLVRDADTAMYRAKARKSGVYEVFDASMHTQAVKRLGLETSLRRAIGRHELLLHYQPIIDLQHKTLVGFEALVRWNSSERGLVQPSDFIPLAEETGLIVPIGRWVLREACAQMVRWKQSLAQAAPLFVSVNMSPRQFMQADLVDQIAAVLFETGFDASLLKLEITESVLIDNIEATAVMMKKLQEMQVRLCIDDFGTGYASLSSLYQLPIHTLKIDRSFVGRLGTGNNHGEIVDTIIMLAHNLNMDVIAEGIETEQQLRDLQQRACDFGQGYYFSRPVGAAAAATIIASPPPFKPA